MGGGQGCSGVDTGWAGGCWQLGGASVRVLLRVVVLLYLLFSATGLLQLYRSSAACEFAPTEPCPSYECLYRVPVPTCSTTVTIVAG